MEEKHNTKQNTMSTVGNKLDILDFIKKCNDDNCYELLTGLLESQSLSAGKSIRECLEIKKPIVDNDVFSIHSYQLEHIQITGTEEVNNEAVSTILTIYCFKTKQGELFNSEYERFENLLKLSKDCINLQTMLAPECTDESILLFTSCRYNKIEAGEEKLFYFTAIAHTKVGTIH